jgi:5-formyltetrahydrofolate cyclo-ligase
LLLWFESNGLHRHMRVTLSSLPARAALRRQLRATRSAIPTVDRHAAATALVRHLRRAGWLAPGARIGLYAALRDEFDLAPLIRAAHEAQCQVYLPRITSERARTMRFVRPTGAFVRNRYGIAEPVGHATSPARFLHLILLPTLGVDAAGARLGYGGGFYDKALAYRRVRRTWRGPQLVAVAFDAQRVPHIPTEPHDIRVDAVATESGITYFAGSLACPIG